MGGCRCSYRNCIIKSEKTQKTHMFHFPVFEKLRCYQWIVNSHRYEFLDLTVSQLKNRVVCQHHFKEDCFMNYKKEKLTFESIPTEDGPYCDSSIEMYVKQHVKAAEKAAAILVENDIESGSTYIDKKAMLTLKYIDFLMNVDASGTTTDIYIDAPITEGEEHLKERFSRIVKLDSGDGFKISKKPNVIRNFYSKTKNSKDMERPQQKELNIDIDQDLKPQSLQSLSPKKDSIIFKINENQEFHNIANVSAAPMQVIENITHYQQPHILMVPLNQSTNINSSEQNDYSNNQQNSLYNHSNNNISNDNFTLSSSHNSVQPHSNEKVKILSEKTIYEPMSVVGQFVPVLPSLVLQVPNRMKQAEHNFQMVRSSTQTSTLSNEIESMAIEQKPDICETECSEDLKNNDVVLKVDILEIDECIQKAPIEMQSTNTELNVQTEDVQKLQDHSKAEGKDDIHRSQISNVECKKKTTEAVPKVSLLKNKVSPERLAAIEKKRIFNKKLRDIVESCLEKPDEKEKILNNRTNILKPKDTENVDTLLPRDNALSSSRDYTLAYLEARMQKMENVLIKKIEQNSNRISDLKNSIVRPKRNSVYTQTPYSDQSDKIFLYEEISKYLSSKAKDLIYEELFIYYTDKLNNEESKPKRKRLR